MPDTHSLKLPLLVAEQAQKHVTHNEALRGLDALVQLSVKDRDLAAAPGSPANGDRYIVAASPTGIWAGHAGDIAVFQDGAWDFHDPNEGFRCWVEDENAFLIFDGSAWVDWGAALGAIQNLSRLGIGTTADATNPFSAKLNKALWTAKTAAEGGDGDLRYTMNKETAADVLSLLLQRNFSGRAELGLIGDDDFSLKVSPDGSSWFDALKVDRNSGAIVFPVSSPGGIRERLTATRTYYVRTDGSNSNSGLANTSGGAFLTIQKAIDVAATLDLNGFDVTIQVADGTYTGSVTLKTLVGGNANIVGNTGTPANVLLNVTGSCVAASGIKTVWTISGVKFQGTIFGLSITNFSVVNISAVDFGACGNQVLVSNNGLLVVLGDYTISGGTARHLFLTSAGVVQCQSRTITLSGTPVWSTAFIIADVGSAAIINGNTYSGAATGKRYDVTLNSVVQTGGGGANYFPGNAAGTTATGGQYA